MVTLYDLRQKPLIEYPLFWDYKVILKSSICPKSFFEQLLIPREFTYRKDKRSAKGNYESFLLSVYVHSEEDRLDIFEKLRKKAQFVL